MTVQFGSLNIFGQKIPQFNYFKIFLFSIWVPISEERKNKSQDFVPENNSIRSVASNCLVSGDAHDLVSRLILSVLVCGLVKINFKNL
jgi:hypothetical protein